MESPSDQHLTGEALTLLPTCHWTYEPLIGYRPNRPFVLSTPPAPASPPAAPSAGDPLADVLDSSRARILRLLDHPHTTTELAARTNLGRTLTEAGPA